MRLTAELAEHAESDFLLNRSELLCGLCGLGG
jgi:hypothetical protein